MGSIIFGGTAEVNQGGQITLSVQFETYVGSGFSAAASSVTIGITAATDQATGQPTPGAGTGTPVPTASTNVTTVNGSLYNYVFNCPAGQVTGDYLVTWTGIVAGVTQTWTQVLTVTAIPDGAPAPGMYATVAQYRAETGDTATPDGLVYTALRKASRTIAHATIGAVYATNAAGMPIAAAVIKVFMEATCAQTAFALADNDPFGIKRQYQSTSMGGVSLTRAPGQTSPRFLPLAPEAAMILHESGVLQVAPLINW